MTDMDSPIACSKGQMILVSFLLGQRLSKISGGYKEYGPIDYSVLEKDDVLDFRYVDTPEME
jgi:hypothetical protein